MNDVDNVIALLELMIDLRCSGEGSGDEISDALTRLGYVFTAREDRRAQVLGVLARTRHLAGADPVERWRYAIRWLRCEVD